MCVCVCVCVYYNGNITISFLHYNSVILHSSDTVFFITFVIYPVVQTSFITVNWYYSKILQYNI